jgi:bacillolysin
MVWRRNKSLVALFPTLAFIAVALSAQVDSDKSRVQKAIAELRIDHPNAKIEMSEKTGLPKNIKGLVSAQINLAPKPQAKLEDVDKIVKEFFSSQQALFLQSYTSSGIKITQRKMDPQIKGRAIARVQQTVKQLDIIGAEAVVAIDLTVGEVDSLTNSFIPAPSVDVTPKVSEAEARALVRREYDEELHTHPDVDDTEKSIAGPEPEASSSLVIFNPSTFGLPTTGLKLSWLVRIGTFVYFVDARDGNVIHWHRDLASMKTRSTYDANFGLNLPGTLVMGEHGPISGATLCKDARLAHDFAGVAYDYYASRFHRDSYDNNPSGGSDLISSVQYSHSKKAYWDKLKRQMIYGPGYASALDVVGHEITHGVINAEVQLEYFGEPGAANESFADFFGVMVAASRTGTIDWQIGKDVAGLSANTPIRDMSSPRALGFDPNKWFGPGNQGQPDYYTDKVSDIKTICASSDDAGSGCVHFNSGILNKAFYLAVVGGPGPHKDIQVTGIGATKAEQILYRTLTADKITSSSQLRDVASGAVAACDELAVKTTAFAISASDCAHFREAFRAVGLN